MGLGLYTSPKDNQAALINRLRERGALDGMMRQLFHDLRGAGRLEQILGELREEIWRTRDEKATEGIEDEAQC